jgi:hypothetical protein
MFSFFMGFVVCYFLGGAAVLTGITNDAKQSGLPIQRDEVPYVLLCCALWPIVFISPESFE